MGRHASGTATFTSWDEEPPHSDHPPVPRLAHAVVAFAYDGDLVATSTCHYVMSYRADGVATFVGLERLDGTLFGDSGGFVMEQRCTFRPDGLEVAFTILEGTGSGALEGLTGTGGYRVGAGETETEDGHRWHWSLDLGD